MRLGSGGLALAREIGVGGELGSRILGLGKLESGELGLGKLGSKKLETSPTP